jgi:hypothetical protein
MSHTPGPWFVGDWSGQCHIDHRHGNGDCKYDYAISHGDEWDRCVSAGSPGNPITLIGWNDYGPILSAADARLIAAAPAMLEALERCVQYLTLAYHDSAGKPDLQKIAKRDHELVVAAIAQATGEGK